MEVQIQKLHKDAIMPRFAHREDAGMDLFALEKVIVPARERALIPTGIAIALPEGWTGLIWDKGGPAAKFGLTTMAGVFDTGYRGDVTIIMYNTTDEDYTFEAGDKVAQMLFQKVEYPTLVEVGELPESERGTGRFGSTGK